MIVVKFGGTSVQDAGCLERAASIVARQADSRPLVVVSAVGHVTRRLLASGKLAAAGAAGAARDELSAIGALHHEILEGLGSGASAGDTHDALDRHLADLAAVIDTISAAADYPPRSQDAVISFGELLSTTLFTAAARAAGLTAAPVDAASLIVTDDRFRHARLDRVQIERLARSCITPHLQAGSVVVTEGFIGVTPDGVPTTMGFEASDLTASLLGAALEATEIQIWTDVPGMLTTGHPAVARPRLVPRLTFDEAAELALFGAKVLHPDTIAPARERNIPVRILHSSNPDAEGTWITSEGGEATGTKSIAVTEDLQTEAGTRLLTALGVQAPTEAWAGQGVVCLVGKGIGADETSRARIGRILSGIASSRLSVFRPDAIPIVVPLADVPESVRRLHEELIIGTAG